MMNNNEQLISFSCSETPIAPIPESDLRIISSFNNRHGSGQRSRQCILRGGRMESLSGIQVHTSNIERICITTTYPVVDQCHIVIEQQVKVKFERLTVG